MRGKHRFLHGFLVGLVTVKISDVFLTTPTVLPNEYASIRGSNERASQRTSFGLDDAMSLPSPPQQPETAAESHPDTAAKPPTSGRFEDFVHHPGVVIAVKIHGENHVDMLKQSLCLLQAAYNYRTLYDILVFATLPLSDASIEDLREIVHPAKLSIAVDELTLQGQLDQMDEEQLQILLDRCYEVNTTADLQWGTRCQDRKHKMPIAYTWMSEFRAKHIWRHAALKEYKYMLWFDSDSFPMVPWDHHDPVAHMMREDLVLYMANYDQSKTPYFTGVQRILSDVYNKTLCDQKLDESSGYLQSTYGGPDGSPTSCKESISQVHGFFHITNLNFYRQDIHQDWFRSMIGRNKFSRMWDDQLAVIIPAAMSAPHRAQEMNQSLRVMHNANLMGKTKVKGGGYMAYWNKRGGKDVFPRALEQCDSKNLIRFGM